MQKFGQMTNYGNETYLAIQAWTSTFHLLQDTVLFDDDEHLPFI